MRGKEIFIIIVLFLVVGGASYYFGYYNQNDETVDACYKGTCYKLEVADEDSERTRGLMMRTNMDMDEGMLFVFESESQYSFWMKDTLIPLDMVWLNSEKEIVYIYEDAKPCTADPCQIITPSASALYVIEFNSGVVQESAMAIGEKIEF